MAARFRYLDHRGEEVGLANAEALAFKIQMGTVDESTLLYDATTDKWAAAGSLPIYQFVLEEILREKAEEAQAEKAAEADAQAGKKGRKESPSTEGTERHQADRGKNSPGKGGAKKQGGTKKSGRGGLSPAEKAPADWAPADKTSADKATAMEQSAAAEGLAAEEEPSAERRAAEEEAARQKSEREMAAAEEQLEKDEAAALLAAAEDDIVDDIVDEDAVLEVESAPAPPADEVIDDRPTADFDDLLGGEAEGFASPDTFSRMDGDDGQPIEDEFERGGQFVASAPDSADAPPYVPVVDRPEADAPPTPRADPARPVRKPIQRLPPYRRPGFTRRMVTTLVVLAGGVVIVGAVALQVIRDRAVEAAVFVFPEEGSGNLAQLPDSIPLTPPLQSMMEAASALAIRDMIASMDSLQRGFQLQESPPPAWLGGLYLSNASLFPEVLSYWESYQGSLSVLREEDEGLFRQSLEERLVMAGATGETLQLLRRRSLADFAARRPLREAAYDQMGELASASIQLHHLLVRREADIAHEPADGPTVSRDPILEAVPADSALNDEVWSYLNRIVGALEASQGVQPVSTARMVESLFDRLLLNVPE